MKTINLIYRRIQEHYYLLNILVILNIIRKDFILFYPLSLNIIVKVDTLRIWKKSSVKTQKASLRIKTMSSKYSKCVNLNYK